MSLRKNVSISLSPELHAVAAGLLASGRYGNFSEVVRAGLRLLDEREREFRDHCMSPRSQGASAGPDERLIVG